MASNVINSTPTGAQGFFDTSAINTQSIYFLVSNRDNIPIPTDSDGNNAVYTFATVVAKVISDNLDYSSEWTFTPLALTNVTVTNTGGSFTITEITADVGTFIISASKSGETSLYRTITVFKSKQGEQGDQGIQGIQGNPGDSIIWLGTAASAPGSPNDLDAYRNSTAKKSYIYYNSIWNEMTEDGTAVVDITSVDDSTIGINGSDKAYVKDGGIGATQIASNGVGTSNLNDASVTTAKLDYENIFLWSQYPYGGLASDENDENFRDWLPCTNSFGIETLRSNVIRLSPFARTCVEMRKNVNLGIQNVSLGENNRIIPAYTVSASVYDVTNDHTFVLSGGDYTTEFDGNWILVCLDGYSTSRYEDFYFMGYVSSASYDGGTNRTTVSGTTATGYSVGALDVNAYDYFSTGGSLIAYAFSSTPVYNGPTNSYTYGETNLILSSSNIVVGSDNISQGESSLIVGSDNNNNDDNNVIVGNNNLTYTTNTVDQNYNVIVGINNELPTDSTTVDYGLAIGDTNTLNTSTSAALGSGAITRHAGELAQSIVEHSVIPATFSGESSIYLYKTTTDNSVIPLDPANDSTADITIPEDSVYGFTVYITGVRTSTGEIAVYEGNGIVKNIGGTTSIVDYNIYTASEGARTYEEGTMTSCNHTCTISGDNLLINVQGLSGATLKWAGVVKIVKVEF